MEFSSKLLQNAVNEVAQLPGIGRRTALRLVLHLMRQPENQTIQLSKTDWGISIPVTFQSANPSRSI